MADKNITFELIDQARKTPRKTALILSKHEIDYGTLDRFIWRTATLLHQIGVRPHNVIGVLQNNDLSRLFLILGLMRLGATVVPLARSLTPHQRQAIAASAKIKSIISDIPTQTTQEVHSILVNGAAIENQKSINYDAISEEPSNDCLLVPGSGSTGKQKIIPQSHKILRQRISIAFSGRNYTSQERVLSLTNLEFASGINRLLSVIGIGGAFALIGRSETSIPDYCKQKKITTLFSSVFHAENFIRQSPQDGRLLFPQLQSLRISGSTVSLNLRNKIRKHLTPHLHLVYGANECGRITAATSPLVFSDPFTVGHPLPGVTLEIVNTKGKPLPCGERGLVRVKTPSAISMYINDPEASKANFQDGWFYTGDIGEIHIDGSLRLFGRADGMMIMNGINIYPIEIEQAIREIPGIQDVAVIPIKHEISQDIPIAVVSHEKRLKINASDIQKSVSERLGFRSPRKVIVIDEIPRNPNGKIQRENLIELIKNPHPH